jgi:hypothetical protein
MLMNVEEEQKPDNFKTVRGIGLYKIKYEMDVQGSTKDQNYIAGVMAYSSDEAVQTLVKFARTSVKGFKGMRTHEVAFEGPIHTMSEAVKDAVLKTSILEGKVVKKEDYDSLLKENKKKITTTGKKKSIISKDE